MSKWKLYWVASDGLEDCFVVAKSSRSAKRIEKEMNGFENQDLRATRIMDIPDKYEILANRKFRDWSKKHDYNKHLDVENLIAWPYYADKWLLDELGAEYRTIEGKEEILINDFVITSDNIYPVGVRAMQELAELTGVKFPDISNVSYEGMRKTLDNMLGICITTIHKIENYITDSFIFAIGNEKYGEFTIKEVTKLWKRKLTFGKLIKLIQERYEIDEDIHHALILFLTQRNRIAHGLTKDERYEIETVWGQKELVAYLALFLRNAWLLEEVFESAFIVSIGVGFNLIKENSDNPELLKTISDFEKDPIIQDKVALFSEVFRMKD